MNADLVVVGRLVLAAFLGGVIGYERELHGRAAGLRTHILVCVGSALIMLTAEYLFAAYQGRATLDPGRFAAQVISGIGFLGAGTILQFRGSVRGLTTAAGLWAAAGIGLAAGTGFYLGAVATTGLVLGALYGLTRWEWGHIRKSRFKTLTIQAAGGMDILSRIRAALAAAGAEIEESEVSQHEGTIVLQCVVRCSVGRPDDALTQAIMAVTGVSRVAWGVAR